MPEYIIAIPRNLITEDITEEELHAEFSYNYRVGKPLPEGVEVITLDRLLHKLNQLGLFNTYRRLLYKG